jgi:hypothetical protein
LKFNRNFGEHFASIFNVEEWDDQESNIRLLPAFRPVSCSSPLKMEAKSSFEVLFEFQQTTLRYIPVSTAGAEAVVRTKNLLSTGLESHRYTSPIAQTIRVQTERSVWTLGCRNPHRFKLLQAEGHVFASEVQGVYQRGAVPPCRVLLQSTKTELRGLSPRANYSYRATAVSMLR